MNMIKQNQEVKDAFSSFSLNDGLDFQKITNELYRHIRIILCVSFCTLIIAFIYTLTLVPQYQTSAILEVKSQNPSSMSVSPFKTGNSASLVDTEMALLRTRYILEPVVSQNALNISASPTYFPIFGKWMAQHHQSNDLAKPFLWLHSYAWGGEIIEIKQFTLPNNLIGQPFHLIAGENNTYKIFDNGGNLILTGTVGMILHSTKIPNFTVQIAVLKARPGTTFNIMSSSPIDVAKELTNYLKVTPIVGSDPTQSTGLLQLQFTGTNPNQITRILNSIVTYAVMKNSQQKLEDSQNTINFLKKRLPELRNNLDYSENALNQYHIKNTTLNMSMISRLLIQELTTLGQAIEKLKAHKVELLQMYTSEHPMVIAADEKIKSLQEKLEHVKQEVRQFPITNQEEINLEREVKIKNTMYVSLLNNQQQAELVKAGITSDIIALTDASPAMKLPSHKLLLLLAGFLLGAFVSSILILLKSTFKKTIENPTVLENELQIPVHSIVPFSNKQQQMQKANDVGLTILGNPATPAILAKREPDDMTIESLRSLRISLHILSPTTHNSVIAIMGGLNNIGKSFVALNLAHVIADTGQRTLLIDADIRKGSMHKNLMQPQSPGLSEYLEGKCSYEDIIRKIDENIYFIAIGNCTKQPITLFQSPRFIELMTRVRNDFEQVIIDTPAVLPVSDSILIAKHCDIKLFVVSADKDSMKDVKEAVRKAQTHGIVINGMVFNHTKSTSPYGANFKYKYIYGKK